MTEDEEDAQLRRERALELLEEWCKSRKMSEPATNLVLATIGIPILVEGKTMHAVGVTDDENPWNIEVLLSSVSPIEDYGGALTSHLNDGCPKIPGHRLELQAKMMRYVVAPEGPKP